MSIKILSLFFLRNETFSGCFFPTTERFNLSQFSIRSLIPDNPTNWFGDSSRSPFSLIKNRFFPKAIFPIAGFNVITRSQISGCMILTFRSIYPKVDFLFGEPTLPTSVFLIDYVIYYSQWSNYIFNILLANSYCNNFLAILCILEILGFLYFFTK